MKKLSLFCVFSWLISSAYLQAQHVEKWEETTLANFVHQLDSFPQEKVYAQLDRYHYHYNDTIWFSLYLLDAATHQPLHTEQIMYAELINNIDSVMARVMIAPDEKGRYYGYLPVSTEYGNGEYTFRAYAPYMFNSGVESFFVRPVIIAGVSAKKKEEEARSDYDVRFFPEGGHLLEGSLCYVGFKSLNEEGLGEAVSGEIVDGEGNIITTFESNHLGMGMFGLTADAGKTYFARCRAEGKPDKEYELPQAISYGYGLHAKWLNNRLLVSVRTPEGQKEKKPLYLLIHCRGLVQEIIIWDHTKEFVAFDKELFPTGVLHIALFDYDKNIYSERLVFCRNEKEIPQTTFQTDKEEYMPREHVSARIRLKDRNNQPLQGYLSVAVTDNNNTYIDTTLMMTSALLLTSELKGHIESPEDYFTRDPRLAAVDLDYLMLTQGWRRYNIASIVKGDFQRPEMTWDGGMFLSGTVLGGFNKSPLKGSKVTLYASTGDFFAETQSDNKGRFSFLLPTRPDSTLYRVHIAGSLNYGALNLLIDTPSYPETGKLYKKQIRSTHSGEFSQIINLPDVSITRKKPLPKPKYPSIYSRLAAKTFDEEYFDSTPVLSWERIINEIPGASLKRDSQGNRQAVINLGRNSLMIEGFARIMLDDLLLPANNTSLDDPLLPTINTSLDDIDLYNVAHIDIIKGARANIFGSEGMFGVISITSKKKETKMKSMNIIQIVSPLGYQQPVEFYSPQYETLNINPKGTDLRKTIFWKPNLETNQEGEASFDFYSADTPTTYTIIIEGIDSEGKIIRHISRIDVKTD